MKGLKWVGVIVILGVIAIALYSALDQGEKSPIFAAGTVELSPELQGDATGMQTMFVTVFDEESPMPMPYGAMKEHLPADFSQPVTFLITKEKLMVMNPDAAQPKRLRVKVRLDKDGVAGPDQPGDLVGIVEHVPFGERNAAVKISQKIGSGLPPQ